MTPAKSLGVLAVLVGTTVVPLDSAVNLDFPFIVTRFHLPVPLIQWVVISYTLTSASLLLAFGRISDLIGARRVFRAGCAISLFAFLLCGAAPSFLLLLCGRVLQGIGAGLLLSCGPALLISLFQDARRAFALGLFTLAFGIGGALGPVAAGPLIADFSWSAVFWARAPIAGLALILSLALPSATVHGAQRNVLQDFDLAGAALLFAATCLMVAALNQVAYPWRFAVMVTATLLMFCGFIQWERRAAFPILEMRLFRRGGFLPITIASVALNLASFAVLLLVPFALSRFQAGSAVNDGLVLALSPGGAAFAGPMAGQLSTRIPSHRLAQSGAMLIAMGLAAIAWNATSLMWLGGAMLLQGMGLGVFQLAYLHQLTETMPRDRHGIAGSLGMLTRTLGIVTGASLLTLIFQTIMHRAEAAGMDAGAAFHSGFSGAFLCATAIAAVAAAVVWIRPPARG